MPDDAHSIELADLLTHRRGAGHRDGGDYMYMHPVGEYQKRPITSALFKPPAPGPTGRDSALVGPRRVASVASVRHTIAPVGGSGIEDTRCRADACYEAHFVSTEKLREANACRSTKRWT